MRTLDWVVLIGSLTAIVLYGLHKSRGADTVASYLLANKTMPWWAMGLSIMATLFSTLSYLGAPGEMIKNGIGMALGTLAVPFSLVVVFYLWIPFFMRLRLTSNAPNRADQDLFVFAPVAS